jgi:hypothetical protein
VALRWASQRRSAEDAQALARGSPYGCGVEVRLFGQFEALERGVLMPVRGV